MSVVFLNNNKWCINNNKRCININKWFSNITKWEMKSTSELDNLPAKTRRWPNVGLTLAQRLRRWPNICHAGLLDIHCWLFPERLIISEVSVGSTLLETVPSLCTCWAPRLLGFFILTAVNLASVMCLLHRFYRQWWHSQTKLQLLHSINARPRAHSIKNLKIYLMFIRNVVMFFNISNENNNNNN